MSKFINIPKIILEVLCMKTKIDKLLKKDIDNLVREVTIDLINYLYEYGF